MTEVSQDTPVIDINRLVRRYGATDAVQWAGSPGHGLLPAGVVAHPPAEYDRASDGLAIRRLGFPDSYAPMTGYSGGWPVAGDGKRVWLTHCYAMVGVGREIAHGGRFKTLRPEAVHRCLQNVCLVEFSRPTHPMPSSNECCCRT